MVMQLLDLLQRGSLAGTPRQRRAREGEEAVGHAAQGAHHDDRHLHLRLPGRVAHQTGHAADASRVRKRATAKLHH